MKGCDNDVQAVLRTSSKPINIKYSLNDDISVMAMVGNGFGISILPELILRNVDFNLSIRPLNPPQFRTIGIASLPISNVSIVTKTFLEYISDTDSIDFKLL